MNKALPVKLNANSLTGIFLFSAAFVFSLFFTGYEDLHYAPALLCLLSAFCIAVIPSFRRGFALPAAPPVILLFAFWLYVTLSLSWSSVPYASLVTYLVFLCLPLSFFSLILTPGRQTWIYGAGMALLAATTILALWAIIQITLFSETYGNRAHHPFLNANSLAGLLNLALVPALGLTLGNTSSLRKQGANSNIPPDSGVRRNDSFMYVLSALLFAALLATGSRGALVAFIIAAAILFLVLKPNSKIIIAALAAGAALIAGAFFFSPFDLSAHSMEARLALWRETLNMAQDHFWLGTGLGTFYLYYPSYRGPGVDGSAGQFAHMDPLQFAAEMGIAAPLLFYALALAILIRTVRALKKADNKAPVLIPFCALLTLFLHTHITFHLYIMPVLIAAGVLLAAWYHETAKILGGRSFIPAPLEAWQKPFMMLITIAIAVMIGIMAASSAWGVYHLKQARDYINSGDPARFIAAIEKAERFAPRSFIDTEVHLAGLYIDLLSGSADGLFTMEEQDYMTQQTRALLDSAATMNPAWAEIDHKRAKLYSVAGEEFITNSKTKAVESWTEALRKNPAHARAREGLAALYIRMGRVESAYETLQAALQYPLPHETKKGFEAIMNDLRPLVEIKRSYKTKMEREPQSQ